MISPCPSEPRLRALLDGELTTEEEQSLAAHVDACPLCLQRLEDLTQLGPSRRNEGQGRTETSGPARPAGLDQLRWLIPKQTTRAEDGPTEEDLGIVDEWPTFPGYETIGVLGRGGMGVVYRARDQRLNRTVAIKQVLGTSQNEAAELLRFRLEGETLARLEHPNIVRIYELGFAGERAYIALELVEEGSLDRHLAGQPLSAVAAAGLVAELAEAVHYAHQQGIIHRDLKPGNILLATMAKEPCEAVEEDSHADADPSRRFPWTPKITDFGLAKLVDSNLHLTETGVLTGTPSYMAPEQVRGRPDELGPAADVYALGTILYECLTGRPPFLAATSLETARLVAEADPVPPRRLHPGLPHDLETICLKCLEKEPTRRYASAEDLAEDLRRFQDGRPIQARRVGGLERAWKWARRHPGVAGLAVTTISLTVALAIASTAAALRINQERHRADAKAQGERQAREAAEKALTRAERASEESLDRLVRLYVNTGSNAYRQGDFWTALLWYQRAWEADRPDPQRDASHRVRLGATLEHCPELVGLCVHDAPVLSATFDPAARRVLTRTDRSQAFLWDPYRGQATAQLRHDGRICHAAFSPDGAQVVTCGEDRMARLWDAATGTHLGAAMMHPDVVHWAAFSPDGRSLATACGDGRIRFWDVPSGAAQERSITCDGPALCVVFHPEGRMLATADASENARLWDAQDGATVGEPLPHRMAPGNPFDGLELPPSFNRDGRMLLTAHGRTVHVLDLQEKTVRHRTVEFDINRVEFDPRADRILVVGRSSGALLLNAAGDELPVLRRFFHPREVQQGGFHPGDGRIVTVSSSGVVHLWDRLASKQLMLPIRYFDNATQRVQFGADGRLLLVPSLDGSVRVWRVDDRSPKPRPLAHDSPDADRLSPVSIGETRREAFAPDGRRSVVVDDTGIPQLLDRARSPAVVARLDLGEPTLYSRFSGNGRRVLTVGVGRARVWEADSGRPVGPAITLEHPLRSMDSAQRLATGAIPYFESVHLSHDGRRLAGLDTQGNVRVYGTTAGTVLLGPITVESVSHPLTDSPSGDESSLPMRKMHGCSLSGDGRRLAVGINLGRGAVLLLYRVDTGRSIQIDLRNGYLRFLVFSDDGVRMLAGSSDRTVRVFETETGRPLGPPLHHRTFVNVGAFSPDGRRIAVFVNNGTLCVWDGITGDLLVPPFPVGVPALTWIWFSHDGRRIIGQNQSGPAYVWSLPAFPVPRDSARDLVRLLTASEIDPTDGIARLPRSTLRDDPDRFRRAWLAWRSALAPDPPDVARDSAAVSD